MKSTKYFIFYILLIILSSCASSKHGSDKSDEIVILTYNVENLFDTIHDEGKNDRTYLPLKDKQTQEHREHCQKQKVTYWIRECLELDWNEEVLDEKMKRLAEVIMQVKAGKGPDLLFLQEVENKRVVEMLRTRYLKDAGYNETILLEGPDKRGIDTAMISRFPIVGEPKLHEFMVDKSLTDGKQMSPTRGILEATFKLPDGSHLTALGVHLPSQYNPTPVRREGLKLVNKIRNKLPADRMVIAAGDFNISQKEDTENKLLEAMMMPYWYISHYIGCDRCVGTHAYRGTWSFLDIIFFSKNLGPKGDAPWKLLPASIDVPTGTVHQISRFRTPQRFGDGSGNYGVSDHWPLTANLKLRKKVKNKKD